MGWLITGGILFLLAVLPLGVKIAYHSDGLRVKLVLGPVKVTLLPKKAKQPKKKKEASKPPEREARKIQEEETLPQPPRPSAEKAPKKEKEKGGSLTDFIPLVKVALDLLGDFRRKLRLDDLYLRLVLASSDPCDLAINYGKTWAAIGNLMTVLETLFVIKKRDVEVECDFTASETLVVARVEITITLGRLLALLAVYGFRGLKEFINLRNKRKGGAVK